MNSNTYSFLRTLAKTLILVTIGSILFTSCGSSNNNRIPTTSTNPYNYNGYNYTPYGGGNGGNQYNVPGGNFGGITDQVKNQVPCNYQMGRLPDRVYSAPGSVSLTAINGNLQPQAVGGTPNQVYVGRNSWGDLLMAVQMTSGASTVGFNIVLSVCASPALFRTDTQLMELNVPAGITITNSNGAAFGRLGAATKLHIQVPQINQYSQPLNGWIDMIFSPLQ
jgi:hypothetical protein